MSVRSNKFGKLGFNSYVLLCSYVGDLINYSVLSPLLWSYRNIFILSTVGWESNCQNRTSPGARCQPLAHNPESNNVVNCSPSTSPFERKDPRKSVSHLQPSAQHAYGFTVSAGCFARYRHIVCFYTIGFFSYATAAPLSSYGNNNNYDNSNGITVVIKDVVRGEGQVIVLYGRWGGGKGRWPTAGVYVSSAEYKRRAQVSSPPWPRATAAGPLNTRLNRDDTGTTDPNNRFTWYSGWIRSFFGGKSLWQVRKFIRNPACTSSARRDTQTWRTRVFRVRARSVHLYSGKNPKQIMVHHIIRFDRYECTESVSNLSRGQTRGNTNERTFYWVQKLLIY